MNVRVCGCIRGCFLWEYYIFRYIFFLLFATVALTRTFVELAGLCNVPEAELGPLPDRWSFPVDVVAGQDGVQEDASETGTNMTVSTSCCDGHVVVTDT